MRVRGRLDVASAVHTNVRVGRRSTEAMRQRPQGWVRRLPGAIDRFEACFSGAPFSSHRHDTYTFCVTLSGVQAFAYRGAVRHSLADGVVVLHPDEVHDGRAGTEASFRYRAINVAPSQLQAVLGGAPLPHLRSGTSEDPRLVAAVRALVDVAQRPLEPLEYDDGLYSLATTLAAVCKQQPKKPLRVDLRAAERARAFIDVHPTRSICLAELERIADRDRWQLSRDFRAVFGTSPYRYALMRRIALARMLLERGVPGAQAAVDCGFSDQSHLIRHFRRAYGLPPKQWCSLLQQGMGRRAQSYNDPRAGLGKLIV